ncbi:uncharacterized protein C8A04DRAFT_39814 [Dichotomopilus funicola]|uniref:DUF4211 domain-containing protein n=1 Tax=Dichotomopilus funicola TaxID=1934379 RepID=A0AAN6UXB2_9PEZI|nr:hypothetical protein C8A04DRAFT_39814 [Dichotomopilus funicola]
MAKKKQKTIEDTLGRPRTRSLVRAPRIRKARSPLRGSVSSPARRTSPPPSFLPASQGNNRTSQKRVLLTDSSDEKSGSDASVPATKMFSTKKSSTKKPAAKKRRLPSSDSDDSSTNLRNAKQAKNSSSARKKIDRHEDSRMAQESDEEEDDSPRITPKKTQDDSPRPTPRPKRKGGLLASKRGDNSESPDEDDDDAPPVRRRRLVKRSALSDTAEDKEQTTPGPKVRRIKPTKKKGRTPKQKARELRRRKRAGEAVNEDDEDSDEEEGSSEGDGALYDSNDDFLALKEFEDEEPDEAPPVRKSTAKTKGKGKARADDDKQAGNDDSDEEDSDSDANFIDDDEEGLLGEPDHFHLMPLEFTANAHKPFKDLFRDVIEWLVQFKVNPGFPNREDKMYRIAWKKLDNEVGGLADSKYSSSSWRQPFYKALLARPYFTSVDLPAGASIDGEDCGACGRSGHPAKHNITFSGSAYYKDTSNLARFLNPVEPGSGSTNNSDSDDEDERGLKIAPQTTSWNVGVTCNANAEMAHQLTHWKMALLDWVDARLIRDGYMKAEKLVERNVMTPMQRGRLVDKIMADWVKSGDVYDLYRNHKGTLEKARNMKVDGRRRR